MLRTISLIIFTITIIFNINGQQIKERYRLMFYNVENLFDTINSPITSDDEFTPNGARAWTIFKLNKKISNIYKVIAAVGQGSPPDFIGFCEIENRSVIEMLLNNTPLRHHGYEIIHKDSRDRRGIDVALIYRKEKYWLLEEHYIATKLDEEGTYSRDILYTKGLIINHDTLHIFVNHWPSKYGGVMHTRPLRNKVATALKTVTDSILNKNPEANIVIMGDLNTTPDDEPIKEILKASTFDKIGQSKLINIITAVVPTTYRGTHKTQGQWNCLDQFIVSSTLIDSTPRLTKTSKEAVYVGNFDFITASDKAGHGGIPFRTFNGYSYIGGYSDHYPIFMDIFLFE